MSLKRILFAILTVITLQSSFVFADDGLKPLIIFAPSKTAPNNFVVSDDIGLNPLQR